jgi:hypothetical protein
MNRFEDNLWESVLHEHGDDLARVEPPRASQTPRTVPGRRVFAGGTLGVAAVAAGLLLALGGSTAPPAFAITTNSDGTVVVQLANVEAIPAAENKLAAMGIDEWFEDEIAPGAATVAGPVDCTIPNAAQARSIRDATHRSASGLTTTPAVKLLLGTNGTSTVPAGNTGAGPWHLVGCYLYAGSFPGTGNTGTGNTGNTGTGNTGHTGDS